jgi:DNA-binding NtrC family response regulator
VLHRARRSVLIADKNHSARQSAAAAFEAAGYAAAECETVADAVSRLEGYPYDALVVDVRLADGDGLDVLDVALSRYQHMRALVTAEFGSLHHAVRALKRGAVDFLVKPCSAEQLVAAIGGTQPADHQLQTQPLPPVARRPQPQARPASMLQSSRRIIGESPVIVRMIETLARVAPMQSTVLIKGETGTGKELVARALHETSSRRDRPFVAFNCAAVPEGLAEAELFGHVKGAFTGAVQSREGRFEAADKGTLFIDEVSSMSLSLQSKLLRALQEREIERVGTCTPVKVNTRVIAATNVDLRDMVRAGTFREDLFYRLSVLGVELPPLRMRKSDIPLLAAHIVTEVCETNGLAAKTLSQETLQLLMECEWPGNVRHLQNAIEYAVAMSTNPHEIEVDALPEDIRQAAPGFKGTSVVEIPATPDDGIDFAATMTRMERDLILRYLEKTGGNRRQAARLLRLSRTTLIDKLQRLGVDRPAPAAATLESGSGSVVPIRAAS